MTELISATEPAAPDHRGGGLVRVRLDIAYDGTDFAGWARQPGRRSVQQTLTEALDTVLREPVALTVAGRTDAGVHATGQVAHLDLPAELWSEAEPMLVRRLAGVLPADLRVRAAGAVPPAFDARFAALSRTYRYRISDDPSGVPPLRRADTLHHRGRLDEVAMHKASSALIGEHDFAAFCRRREGASTIRGLEQFAWVRDGSILTGTVRADAFCHSMVRSVVGAVLAVGEGRRPVSWPGDLLRSTTRSSAVAVVPAHGLTLVEVQYPTDAELAARVEKTRRPRGPFHSSGPSLTG